MSLRDQMLKAGLVSKKKHAKVNREQKSQRKNAQSRKEKRRVIEARELKKKQEQKSAWEDTQRKRRRASDAREAARHKAQAESQAERKKNEAIQAKKNHIDQLISAHQIRHRGGQQLFYFIGPNRISIRRLRLPERLAEDIRIGALAIVWRGAEDADELDVVLIPHNIAKRVGTLESSRVLYWNSEPPDPEDPAQKLSP